MSNDYDVLVIGGGQAGLAAGYHLQRAGLHFAILEAGPEPTGSRASYYDSLKLFSPARYSALPGLRFPGDPERYPARERVVVVGAGNSAVQVAVELAQHTHVTLTSREPVRFRAQRICGKDVHFWLTLSRLDTITHPHL